MQNWTIGKLEEALAEDPDQADLYTELGELYFIKGDLDKALATWIKAYGRYASAFVDDRAEAGHLYYHIYEMEKHGYIERALESYRQSITEKIVPERALSALYTSLILYRPLSDGLHRMV
jgi:tetratricopeptide (TPR) repeat protein